ncbi:MAG: hypothetical protein C0602_11480 [Denitrovibrio sp.]|nr:MAG: hypothetical protein C0602_11480 [Denitrovibrio sp.]
MKDYKIALIGAAAVIIAAVVTGIFSLSNYNKEIVTINGDNNTYAEGNIVYNYVQEDKAVSLSLLESTEVHLGDNIFPGIAGTNYNPDNLDIFPQEEKGIIYFDKENNSFKGDKSVNTQVVYKWISEYSKIIEGLDFSAYKYVQTISANDKDFNEKYSKYSENSIELSPGNFLISSSELKGNFYRQYAAIALFKTFSLGSILAKNGISPDDKLKVKILIDTFHGGLRPGQSENYYFQINDYVSLIPSKTYSMRDKQVSEFNIPIESINFDKSNSFCIFVLPWIEDNPRTTISNEVIKPVHFRDVGITNIELIISSG